MAQKLVCYELQIIFSERIKFRYAELLVLVGVLQKILVPIPRIPPQSFQDFINKNKKIPLKIQYGTENLFKIPKMRSVKSTLKLIMCKLKSRRYTREISSKFAIKIKKKNHKLPTYGVRH